MGEIKGAKNSENMRGCRRQRVKPFYCSFYNNTFIGKQNGFTNNESFLRN